MKEEWVKVLQEMRREGYAVVVFNPKEMRGTDPNLVEDRLCELGWDVIDSMGDRDA